MTSENWAEWRRRVDVGTYDDRWRRMEAAGVNPHGEADLVWRFAPRTVLDGGCGTGRVAIELARRGVDVVGVDLDDVMLAVAREKAPELTWLRCDLAHLDLGDPPRRFDVVVLAGNVARFVAVADRPAVVAACSRHLTAGDGRLISGFQLDSVGPDLADYDRWADDAGLVLEHRFSTWDGQPFAAGGGYAVSVHRTTAVGPRRD
jgi:SAM-dependent methyltransferase